MEYKFLSINQPKRLFMHYNAERNERQGRRQALVLAIALHLALAAVLYFYTGDASDADIGKPALVKIDKERPAANSRPAASP